MSGLEVVFGLGAAFAGAVGAGHTEYHKDAASLAAPKELPALRSALSFDHDSVIGGHRAVSSAWGVSPPLTLLREEHLAAASRRGVAVPQLLAVRRAKDAVEEATALEILAVEYEKQIRMAEERGEGLCRMYLSELIERLEELGERLSLRVLPELVRAKVDYDRCHKEPEGAISKLPPLSPCAPRGTDTVLRQMVGRWHYNNGSNSFRISKRYEPAEDFLEFSERNSRGALRGELRPNEKAGLGCPSLSWYSAELVWEESGQSAGTIELAYEDGLVMSRHRPVGGDFCGLLRSQSLDLREEILQSRGRLGVIYSSAAERISPYTASAKDQGIAAGKRLLEKYAPGLSNDWRALSGLWRNTSAEKDAEKRASKIVAKRILLRCSQKVWRTELEH